ncbi:unnamed protein product [Lactuca saligna]|uniref:Uncharacterized protein n=1 Tax=Lactuca saligna TaxID=75948 RepID=A0AA35YHV1_LACSI|nr:unnamed protein product [Lactuca saligna]
MMEEAKSIDFPLGTTLEAFRQVYRVAEDPCFLCNYIVPASINSTKVGIEDHKVCNEAEIKMKPRSCSNRFTSSSSSPSSSSVDRPKSHGRTFLPSSLLLMLNSPSSQAITVCNGNHM